MFLCNYSEITYIDFVETIHRLFLRTIVQSLRSIEKTTQDTQSQTRKNKHGHNYLYFKLVLNYFESPKK